MLNCSHENGCPRSIFAVITVSGKLASKNMSATSRTVSGIASAGNQSRHASGKNHSTHITRSSSVGVLNQVCLRNIQRNIHVYIHVCIRNIHVYNEKAIENQIKIILIHSERFGIGCRYNRGK